jgi:hypothetical protein
MISGLDHYGRYGTNVADDYRRDGWEALVNCIRQVAVGDGSIVVELTVPIAYVIGADTRLHYPGRI